MTSSAEFQALRDELDIRELIVRISHLTDDGSMEDYKACLAEDARWEMLPVPGSSAPVPPIRINRDEMCAGAQARRDAGTQGPGTRTRHVLSTTSVRVHGDRAEATSNILFVEVVADKPQISFVGRYDDEYRRTPGGWKLSRRVVTSI